RPGDLVTLASDERQGDASAGFEINRGPGGQAVEEAQRPRGAARRGPQSLAGNLINERQGLARAGRGDRDGEQEETAGEGSKGCDHVSSFLGIGERARRRIAARASAIRDGRRRGVTGHSRPVRWKI